MCVCVCVCVCVCARERERWREWEGEGERWDLGEAEWNCRENEGSWTTSLGMAVTSYFISLGLSILMAKRKHWTGSYEVPSSFD